MKDREVLQMLIDRMLIADVVNKIATLTDSQQWTELVDCCALEVEADFSSSANSQVEILNASELVQRWRNVLSSFKSTQHMLVNDSLEFYGERATCTAHFQTSRHLPNDKGASVASASGFYYFELVKSDNSWRVCRIKMTALQSQINQYRNTAAAMSS